MAKDKEAYPKARKEYKCQYCWHAIHIGQIYYLQSYLDISNGKWYVYRLHVECKDLFFDALNETYNIAGHWEEWYEQTFV
jgi:hypothetical protein